MMQSRIIYALPWLKFYSILRARPQRWLPELSQEVFLDAVLVGIYIMLSGIM